MRKTRKPGPQAPDQTATSRMGFAVAEDLLETTGSANLCDVLALPHRPGESADFCGGHHKLCN